ncbi:MAG: hypothetical protein Q4P14_04510, partial [Methanobacteriaceae archaeon]|nr:hypothetical protein [Methanobacteriaceae archaeon]
MLIRIKDLVNIADEKFYDVDIKTINADDNPYLKRLEDNKGTISFFYDYSDKLCISYKLTGKMVCPDSLTLEDVYQDYSLDNEEEVALDENDEGFYIYGDMEIDKIVYNLVLPEVPIIVENCNKTGYYSGDGWS